MSAEPLNTVTTETPRGGLPQMQTETFPSQIFWLVVTFGLLFLVLWRVTLPMIEAIIGERRNRIEGDLGTAEKLRQEASNALAAYEAELAGARSKAHRFVDENRKKIGAELDVLKVRAQVEAQAVTKEAEERVSAEHARALSSLRTAAAEAASAIVERLIGKTVSSGRSGESRRRAAGDHMIGLLHDPEFWVAVGTAIFLAILVWKRVPQMTANSLDSRAAAIAREIEEARRLRLEAEALLAQYRQRQAAAETEAQGILAEARAEAERFGVEARAAAAAQIARRARQARDKIAQAEAHALADIRAAAADAAISAAGKLIANRLDENAASDLVRRSLADIPDRLQ